MTTIEKVAYLKGLFEGMEIDESTKEGKLLKAVMDVLADLAVSVEDLEDYTAELTAQVDAIDEDLDALETEQVDAVDEDLSSLEDVVYEELDDECDGDCEGCDGCDDWDDDLYDVTCPSCKESFEVDEETLLDGGVDCPNCGEHLEFDIEDDEDEDETEE